MGGKVLSGLTECVVVDIGGTSTDIAVLRNGLPRVAVDGSTVGRWRTRVEAVDMWTAGLGGDSEVRVAPGGALLIGPERVVPLCLAAEQFPHLKENMKAIGQARFLMASPKQGFNLSPTEAKIIGHLKERGPLAPSELKKDLEEIILLDSFIKSLKQRGAVFGIGLTPTDVLHAEGIYVKGDAEASKIGVDLFARVTKMADQEFMKRVREQITSRIAEEMVRKLLSDELGELPNGESFQGVMDLLSGRRCCPTVKLQAMVNRTVVGLGAPAKVFVSPLADILNVDVVIPENYEVGNAVGAMCGQVSEYVDVYVYPRDKDYAIFSALNAPIPCGGEDEAVRRAKELATKYALDRARTAGGVDLKVEMKVEEERGRSNSTLQKDELVQMRIRARAIGRPATSEQ
jgi:N-methylhydantoinase A/oxoprolinase/acetone carboxylase beta subunit